MNQPKHMAAPNSGSLLSLHKIICLIGIIIGASYYLNLWNIGSNGVSVVSNTTPYWDFNNLWTGGRLALDGHVDYLFDMNKYRPEMRELLGPNIFDQEWSYPPSMLLIGVPLAIFPAVYGYIIWTLGSILLLHIAVRPLQLKPLLHLAILLSPTIFINAMYGQNGTFISALLIMALVQLPKRPILAGVCIGIMTIKPQFGLLIPFLLISSGNWRAFVSASVTAMTIALGTGLIFGFGVWTDFLATTQPMMRGFMEAPFYHPYQVNSVTPFTLARALGASVNGAYVSQAVISLAAIIFTYWLWRPTRNILPAQRIALTLVLTMLATPYGYTYDMVAVFAAIVIFVATSQRVTLYPLLAVIWLYPLYNHILAWKFGVNIGALIVAGLFLLLYLTWRRERNIFSSQNPKPAA